jgi:acyl dehydratase
MTTTLHFDQKPALAGFLLKALLSTKSGKDAWPSELTAEVAPSAPDSAWVASYRKICGFAPEDTLPATIPQVLAVPMHIAMLTHPTFPLKPMGIVHVRQTIQVIRPIRVGEAFGLRSSLSAPRQAKRGREFDLSTDALVNGEVVWKGVTTILAPERQAASDKPTGKKERVEEPAMRVPGNRLLQSASWSLSESLGRDYTRVAGDFNPIHLHAWAARPFGFKKAIIHGMWLLGRTLADLQERLPDGPYEVSMDFRRAVSLPSRVFFVAEKVSDTEIGFSVRNREQTREHVTGYVKTGAA